MKVAILMVTYGKDLDFAHYAFRAATRYATGFCDRVVVVPEQDVAAFEAIAPQHGWRVVGFAERPACGMLHHMVKILEADLICPRADAVLHLDADCLFTEPVTPADYLRDGRPILLRQPYEEFRNYGSRYSWKKCVREATGIDPEWETMVRHPNVHLAQTYRLTREAIGSHRMMDWREYILSCRNTYPQTFAEFPTLGAVAIAQTPDAYEWADWVGGKFAVEPGPAKMLSLWSHGGLDMVNDRHPGKTARQAMDEILAGATAP